MPFFGAHVSVAGGYALAVERARRLGCDAFQIFSRNANRWQPPPLTTEVARGFRTAVAIANVGPVVSHGSYLVNLGAPDGPLRSQSIAAVLDEIDRADALGLLGVVMHPGSCGLDEEHVTLARIAKALRDLLRGAGRKGAMVLLEATAGQGRSVGHCFEHLASIIDLAGAPSRLGVCLDTCHLVAAGYDLSSAAGYGRTMEDFGRRVGFDRLRVLHVNDSKKPRGSRVDRHAHIGEGYVGIDAFWRLVNDPRLAQVPMLIETEKCPLRKPSDTTPDPLDAMNLARLRALVGQRRRPATSPMPLSPA